MFSFFSFCRNHRTRSAMKAANLSTAGRSSVMRCTNLTDQETACYNLHTVQGQMLWIAAAWGRPVGKRF